ncbi:actin [Colletotrichum aenigma]|uniref:actin n=1 Tax=Colletotrichum aenigma TaxID=1215731 RepID=UPI0018730428|nr:actin [Colletotrichum aenigma]KAF5526396.1 actin [Colletotrichum aenigma]
MGVPAVVIDNGSGFIKAGFGGDQHPSTIFPSVIQYPTRSPLDVQLNTSGWQSVYNIGHAVNPDHPIPGFQRIRRPLDPYGMIQTWDDMDKIWRHTYKEIGANPSSHPVIMTEPGVHAPKDQRLRQTTYVFESLHAHSYFTTTPALLSSYAANLPTALVVDSGHTATSILPVRDFAPLHALARRCEVAGQAVDDWLAHTLRADEHVHFPSNGAADDFVRLAKFERVRVAMDFEKEYVEWTLRAPDDEKRWTLPDGKSVVPGRPVEVMAGEVMFNHAILGLDVPEFYHGVCSSVANAGEGFGGTLLRNMLLAGGNTMIPGYGERLQKELERILPKDKVNVISPRNRIYSAWIGGSIVSQLSTFKNMCISREEYDETGPEVVNRKCL